MSTLESLIIAAHRALPEDIRSAPATIEELAAFESNFGPIPPAYRWYLEHCGGGVAGSEWLDDIHRLAKSHRKFQNECGEGGWTLRQTVHHIADSHINSLCRFKLALTEDETPTIVPYYEDRWAELADSNLPVDASLAIIDGVHARWAELLRNMSDADYAREFKHPETGPWTLEKVLGLYAWHSLHHTAHISTTREKNEW